MRPVRNYNGEWAILSVGNGGVGLSLMGSSGNPDFHVPPTKYFAFMRTPQVTDDEAARAIRD
jgi:hypothetical protein